MASVRVHEVCLRDGLQNEPVVVATATKLRVVEGLVSAGFRDIEVTSFVRPRLLPQLADASEVIRGLPEGDHVRFWALVPNAKGLDRALDAGVGHIATFMSSSETHNQRNVNRTIRESLGGLRRVLGDAKVEGLGRRAYISTVFGCPFEGDVPVEQTIEIAHALLDCGAQVIALGDTTGMADPEQVKRVITAICGAGIPMDALSVHFHDTRGTALANAYAAWQLGIRHFDGSVSGVGGCPYAPGAAGNVCTQDLLYLFTRLGETHGIDLAETCEVGGLLEDALGRPLPGRYHQFWRGNAERKAQTA
ncbi:MAG: hydroxymethylglutaryl-CoA lyase [Myxococcota bacterium]|jgi:hydroxymethylglutaryl-CoA lyase